MQPGTRLGPYQIDAPIGAGGMGQVFRATDTRLQRTVAIKILPHDKVADPDRKRRFLQEARAASALNHPNIVTVHDIAQDAGVDYLVMEYVPGTSLDHLIPAKGLPVSEALGYAQQIAGALAAAHAAGIVHRDIKPANVMVTPESQVKVLDFGLAKLTERRPGPEDETVTESVLTEAGTVMGTVAYMSPEQAAGRPLDHRTDIFSLGIILYEMLSGARPFRGKSPVETMSAIINEPCPPLPAAPPRLREILDKALEKDPRERYQSGGDLAVDLRRAQRTAPAVAPSRVRPWPWAAAAALTVAIAAAGWLWINRSRPAENPLAGAKFTRFTDFEGTESDAAISRDGRFVAFRSDREGPMDTWVSQVGSGRFVNLTHGTRAQVLVRNEGFTPDGSEIWLSASAGGDRMRLVPLMGGTPRPFLSEHAMEAAWSPDGSQVVYHPYDAGDPMFVADRNGSNPRQIFTLNADAHSHFFTWSKDGQWIYFVSGLWNAREMDIWRIRPSGGAPERLTNLNSDIKHLTPLDNRTMLYVSPDQDGGGPWLWALDTDRRTTRRISSGLEIYTSVDASGDGRRLAATVSNPVANLWSVPILDRTAEESDVQPFTLPSVRAWAPRYGGTSLFYLSSSGGGDGLWRFDKGQATEIWRGADGALLEPAAISADGQHVAVILRKQGKRTLNTLSADGGDVRPIAASIDVTAMCWSPDGKWIAAGGADSKGAGLFKIPVDGGEPQRIVNGAAANPVWSPDGSVIVYTGPVVGPVGPLLMVGPDGTPVEAPPIAVRVGTEHYRFVPGRQELVYLPTPSQVAPENFWLLDLQTKKTRKLANFNSRVTRTFDITPDGKQIVFDRLRDNSDIVLIDLPAAAR